MSQRKKEMSLKNAFIILFILVAMIFAINALKNWKIENGEKSEITAVVTDKMTDSVRAVVKCYIVAGGKSIKCSTEQYAQIEEGQTYWLRISETENGVFHLIDYLDVASEEV